MPDPRPRAKELWQKARPSAAFVIAFALLNSVVNVRYPEHDPQLWYVLPALDVVILLSVFSAIGLSGRTVPRALHVGLVVLLFCVRVLRFGEGVQHRYFDSQFNAFFDLPLVPELVRLMHSTLPLWKFCAALVALAVGLVALGLASSGALRYSAHYLRTGRHVAVFAALLAASLSVATPTQRPDRFATGALVSSAMPALAEQLVFAARSAPVAESHRAEIRRVRRELERTPQDLRGLAGQHVFLFVVESYGRAAVDQALLAPGMRAVWQRFEETVGKHGYQTASAWLESSTYAGRSWLAHATLATGVQTTDQLAYRLVLESEPLSLAYFFGRAGYRTVLAGPGTTRPFRQGDAYRFHAKYYAWQYGYVGPRFSWALMPDQFVVDFVHRREVATATRPLFIEYALVSSHTPWDIQPPLVEDWKSIGKGAIYSRLPAVRFDVTWPELNDKAPAAYVRALSYDFDVLMRYLAEFVAGDALIIILGDHQPPREITQSDSRDVPVHVVSRRRVFIDAFRARGYTPGMVPTSAARRMGMRQFLPELLRTFSSPNQKQG
ncbi:MAG TPA: sulfatase-like hydrolase/transferase [Polyangiaceae bacterium]